MSDIPPPSPADERFATPPTFIPTAEVLFRFKRLVGAMAIVAVVLAFVPVPAVVHVIVLLVLPVFVLIIAVQQNDFRRDLFIYRYTRKLWEHRRDRATLVEAGERAREPVSAGLRRAWLLLALFVAIFAIGLVFAGASAGISEGLYG